MSEGPNKNCEFYENYEKDLRGTQRELQKLQISAKVPRMAHVMSEGPNENCEFYENYENYDNCENLQRPLREPMRIKKTAKIPKGTKKALRKPS